LQKFRNMFGLATAAILITTSTGFAFPLRDTVGLRAAARDFGPANPAQEISVTVHLKLPNEALLEKTVNALYDPHSPTFHHWLTDAQLRQFGPSTAAITAVRAELARNGLSITSVANDGFSIQARGPIAAIQRAFHTEIHQFSVNGKSGIANTRPATLSGVAGSYLSFVSGLQSHTVRPALAQAINPATRRPFAAVPLRKVVDAGGLSSIISDQILGPKTTYNFTTNGKLPTATYTGLTYSPNSKLVADFTPSQLERIYGLDAAYAKGLTGKGQTIVLLEGYGYPTAEADANAFSQLAGLPPLNSSNFQIVYPAGTPPPQAGVLAGWDIEIALDIDWAHSTAPGAKIVVVATRGQDSQDFEGSMQYIIDHKLGYTVSDSWEEDQDYFSGPFEQKAFNTVLIAAAAQGINFDFSTGDGGDGGLGTPAGAAGVPSVDPYATAVGGTALVNLPDTSNFTSVGWGDVFDVVVDGTPVDPPNQAGFVFSGGGGGGGQSQFWRKPTWQSGLPGLGRQTPDISALSDPYTGVPIVITLASSEGPEQVVYPGWGGTSLGSPIFTGMWALAQAKAGKPLGQAAPLLAGLKTGITDVLPGPDSDFSASVTDTKGTTTYTEAQLFAATDVAQKHFLPVVWNLPQYEETYVIGFGADTSLTVGTGWDNATGFGTPAGLGFIDAAAAAGK
jgi:subtilase family serine protease